MGWLVNWRGQQHILLLELFHLTHNVVLLVSLADVDGAVGQEVAVANVNKGQVL